MQTFCSSGPPDRGMPLQKISVRTDWAPFLGSSEYCEYCESPDGAGAICRVLGQYVGFVVGFFGLPDKHSPFAINQLDAICRVCRVFCRRREPQRIWGQKTVVPTGARTRTARRPFWTPLGLQNAPFGRTTVRKSLRNLVGLPRFELGTSCTPSKRASQAAPQPDPVWKDDQCISPPELGCAAIRC